MPRYLRRPLPHEEPTHSEMTEMLEEIIERLDRIEGLLRK